MSFHFKGKQFILFALIFMLSYKMNAQNDTLKPGQVAFYSTDTKEFQKKQDTVNRKRNNAVYGELLGNEVV